VQEIDFGFPHRFEIGCENDVGLMGGRGHETSATVEARYAFGNWNNLPLNPALSAEYVFGFGKSATRSTTKSHGRGVVFSRQPDAFAVRLLLGQNFGQQVGYGLNLALQQDVADSGREFQLSQSVAYGILKGALEIGGEMRYTHATAHDNFRAEDDLGIGPDISWKPTRQWRIGFAPLFGCTHDSPRVTTFLLVSYEFGGAEAIVAPVSER
jgi:hypothetical protein